MKIKVEQKHIDAAKEKLPAYWVGFDSDGKPKYSITGDGLDVNRHTAPMGTSCCPIERAVIEQTDSPQISVGYTTVAIYSDVMTLPAIAREFIRAFDNNRDVEPIEFEAQPRDNLLVSDIPPIR